MKDLSRQILSLLLISTLLIGLSGINLHHHICGSTGSHYVSLDNPENPCGNCKSCTQRKETQSCCTALPSDHCEEATEESVDDYCCSDYMQTLELKVNIFTDTAKKVLKRAVTFVYFLINISPNENKEDKDHFITSDDFQFIKIPIQKVISFIHISARSAYAS
jgi:hypothetical protein